MTVWLPKNNYYVTARGVAIPERTGGAAGAADVSLQRSGMCGEPPRKCSGRPGCSRCEGLRGASPVIRASKEWIKAVISSS